MTMYEKLNKTMLNRDVDAYQDILHKDFTVVFHKSGNSFAREEWIEMVRGMMANEKFIQESSRCVYENDEIIVVHSFCLLYTSPSPRDVEESRMPSSA